MVERPLAVPGRGLKALDVLAVFNLLLYVLVALQDFVVFDLTKLKALIHAVLKLLFQSVHLILLSVHQVSLRCKDLLVAVDVELAAFLLFKNLGSLLHLVGLFVILLLSQTLLDLDQIQKLG
jgi:hypothetical protein